MVHEHAFTPCGWCRGDVQLKTNAGSNARLLVLVRHAQAGDAARFHSETGRPDRERPLTGEGVRNNRAAAAGLRRLLQRVNHVWSSPYTRAVQTAEDLGESFAWPIETPDLLLPPWNRQELEHWLGSRLLHGQTGILVGHEPDLSLLIEAWLCGAARHAPVPMEKGAACALRVADGFGPGAMELIWKLPQYGLIKLGGGR